MSALDNDFFLLEFAFEKKSDFVHNEIRSYSLNLLAQPCILKPDDDVDMSIRVFFAPILLDSILNEFSDSQNRFLMTIVSGSLMADTTL